jgi:RecJ-like exonuclease
MNCEACNGTGKSANPGQPCFLCNGNGRKCDICGEAVNDVIEEICDACKEENSNQLG